MSTLIAYCGLDCAQCPAFIATQANDQAAQEKLVAQWRVEFNAPDMPLVAVICDGCASAGRHGGYCGECPIRACAVERGLENCAHCADFGCSKLQAIVSQNGQALRTLEAIRKAL